MPSWNDSVATQAFRDFVARMTTTDGRPDATLFYDKWAADRMFLLVPAQALVGQFLKTFEAFPPCQKPASFSIDDALEKARESEKHMATAYGGGVK
jgi:arylsulfatase